MVEINWRSDYNREFACPRCGDIGMRLGGGHFGKQRFLCPKCRKTSGESEQLSSIRAKIKNYWATDYNREFACPDCGEIGIRFAGNTQAGKKIFFCPKCHSRTYESVPVILRHSNYKDYWKTDYKVGEFACPNPDCHVRNVYLHGYSRKKGRKRIFNCRTCGATTFESLELNPRNIRHYGQQGLEIVPIQPFDYNSNKWDLRAILSSIDARDIQTINFDSIQCNWFREMVKRYVYHLCKLDTSAGTIAKRVSHLRLFSRYLASRDIRGMEDVDRNLIINFWVEERQQGARATAINNKWASFRDFFWTGNSQGWFQVEQDIIRNEDLAKRRRGNPDPIPDSVRQQIEDNLHKLPDPIARMWITAFFTAMRPSELAFLKKDCLVQEGGIGKLSGGVKKVKISMKSLFLEL
jgi:transcription elongation factor Elf1/site-specific recombinase XerC